jgi:trehalose 6-phosphate phosphatase
MASILAREYRPTLARFAASNVLVAFDYDGTLAPMVSEPGLARMRPSTRRLLASVATRYPTVVISGRSRADLIGRITGVPLWEICGNHGIEPWDRSPKYRRLVRQWARQLRDRLAAFEGVIVEDKKYSLAIHYRHARNKREALRAIKSAVRSLKGAHVTGGIKVVNVLPRGAPHKGVALKRARRLLGCDTAIFVGDDETDEHAFASGKPHHLLSIRIGPLGRTHARYRLHRQRDVDPFLRVLVGLREHGSGIRA